MNEIFTFILVFLALVLFSKVGDFRIQKLNASKINFTKISLSKGKNSLTVEWLEELAAKLQGGTPARVALFSAVENTKLFNTKHACASGSSISYALKNDLPEDDIARALSSCWDICEEAGIGLAEIVTQLVKGVQTKNQLSDELNSSLTQSKLSVWVLALLPLFGLMLASLVGENPIYWLFTNNFGLTVLLLGIIFELIGIYWVTRITNKVKNQL